MTCRSMTQRENIGERTLELAGFVPLIIFSLQC